jgi:hypothetical protein
MAYEAMFATYEQNGNLLDVYYLEKLTRCQGNIKRLDFIYNIILYISDNTHIPPIPPINTTHTVGF